MSQTKAQLLAPVGIFTASGINVSGTLTATSYSGSGANLFGVGVGTTASVNTSGIITAVSFSGDGSNLSGVGFGTEDSAVTTGIVTASKFSGSGIGLTNVGGPIVGLVYNPSIGSTTASISQNIEIIFNKPIQAGVGTITLRTDSATGTIIESFDVGTSSSISINTAKLVINPTDNLSGFTTYFVVVPSGTLKDTYAGISSNVGITTYSFTTGAALLAGQLWVWGDNTNGELGQNNITQYSSPIQVPGNDWLVHHGNYDASIAIKPDGTLWAWGYGLYLPFNSATDYSSPVQVPGTQWSIDEKAIAVALQSQYAIKTDGTLWSWGTNSFGELGQGSVIPRSSPVQIPGTQWKYVFVDDYYYHVDALKSDGTLWAWGLNYHGQLGQNNTTQYSSPVQIPGTQWSFVSGGSNCKHALKTDGTLWSLGYQGYGQLGLNSLVSYSSPVQVPGTQWSTVSFNNISTLAAKTDGTLWAWGYNGVGPLGQNSTVNISSPVQIPGTQWGTSFKDLAQLYRSGGALKTDGTIWVWGANSIGLLGQGNLTNYSSPVQVPGTQWYRLGRGQVYQMSAIKLP